MTYLRPIFERIIK
jgi:hypothetical protein